MKNLYYTQLKIKEYLTSKHIKPNQAIVLFKYRTGMAPFGENFRGGRDPVPCPLCMVGLDNAEHAWGCSTIRNHIKVESNFSEIFNDYISVETVNTAMEILRVRESIINKTGHSQEKL